MDGLSQKTGWGPARPGRGSWRVSRERLCFKCAWPRVFGKRGLDFFSSSTACLSDWIVNHWVSSLFPSSTNISKPREKKLNGLSFSLTTMSRGKKRKGKESWNLLRKEFEILYSFFADKRGRRNFTRKKMDWSTMLIMPMKNGSGDAHPDTRLLSTREIVMKITIIIILVKKFNCHNSCFDGFLPVRPSSYTNLFINETSCHSFLERHPLWRTNQKLWILAAL